MRKTFKYRLYPTGAVEHKLLWMLSRCRELYLEGKIKTVTIKREVDEWYVTFSCEVEELEWTPSSPRKSARSVGKSRKRTCPNAGIAVIAGRN